MTTVAIIGTGNVGGALARTFQKAGIGVRIGTRQPAPSSAGAPAEFTPAEAAQGADAVFLCVPAAAAVEATRALGPLEGRILVDCTNPVSWNDGPVLAPPPEGSVAQALQKAFPATRVIKAFNHFGAEIHAEPGLPGHPSPALIAGDDPEAKKAVADLARRAGFDPVDAGPLRNAGLLEAMAVLWIHLATKGGRGRRWTFTLAG
jgi:predicted dinucleotide-binding enzyme